SPQALKITRAPADPESVETPVLRPHHIRSNPRDLEALATVWRWEGIVQRLLPRVLETNDIETRFQAVYDVRPWVPVLRGYEAYARFPAAPEVPTGLWFRTAEHMGLGRELSLAAGRTALTTLRRIPRTAVLFVNTFPEAMADLVEAIEPDSPGRVVFDVPAYSFNGCDVTGQVDSVRHAGMGVSFDGAAAVTRSLLGYGVVAGVFYLVVGVVLGMTREGFDFGRHPLS